MDRQAAFAAVDLFCKSNPVLDSNVVSSFVGILKSKDDRWDPQTFVRSVLERYDSFDSKLMAPMLRAAIEMNDPSWNKYFLYPCVRSFDPALVVGWLADAFSSGDRLDRIGVSRLMFWLECWSEGHSIDATDLKTAIENTATKSNNLIELYFYRMALPEHADLFPGIPDGASDLQKAVCGNEDLETLLYNKLGWRRPEAPPTCG